MFKTRAIICIFLFFSLKSEILKGNIGDDKINNRYCLINEFSFCPGFGTVKYLDDNVKRRNTDFIYGYRAINGLKINDKIFIGISTGIILTKYFNLRSYDFNLKGLFPVGLDGRFYFFKGKTNPYLNINMGYSIGKRTLGLNIFRGGIYFNPSLGIKKIVYKRISCLISIGYSIQNGNYIFEDKFSSSYNPKDRLSSIYQNLYFNIGFILN